LTSSGSVRRSNDWKFIATLSATLLGIICATAVGLYTVHESNVSDRRRADDAFVLAAAQVVMAQPTCKLAQARARQLVRVFPTLRQRFVALTEHPLSASLCKQLRTTTAQLGFTGPQITSARILPGNRIEVTNPFGSSIASLPKALRNKRTITLANPSVTLTNPDVTTTSP
jgi:hypothetical protein